jgi:hypothetical protein
VPAVHSANCWARLFLIGRSIPAPLPRTRQALFARARSYFHRRGLRAQWREVVRGFLGSVSGRAGRTKCQVRGRGE